MDQTQPPNADEYDFFLSGPISGHADYRQAFAKAVVEINRRHPGSRIWNPAELPAGRDYRWYMWQCCIALFSSRRIVLLPGWFRSPGALAENFMALCLKIPVLIV